jgi:hypothetical protein
MSIFRFPNKSATLPMGTLNITVVSIIADITQLRLVADTLKNEPRIGIAGVSDVEENAATKLDTIATINTAKRALFSLLSMDLVIINIILTCFYAIIIIRV